MMVVRKILPARLERKLAADASAILNPAEIRPLNLNSNVFWRHPFQSCQADLVARSEEAIRWHALVGATTTRNAMANAYRASGDVSRANMRRSRYIGLQFARADGVKWPRGAPCGPLQ